MNPRAIALQGIGFGPTSMAVQGFVAMVQPEQPPLTYAPLPRKKAGRKTTDPRRDNDDDFLVAILL